MKLMNLRLMALAGIAFVSALGFMLDSCKNPSKAKPVIEEVIRTYKAASKTNAVRYLKTQNRIEMAENIYNGYIAPSPCHTCNGYGVVYQVDMYGNPYTDYYGNIIYYFCPHCGGTGQQQN